MKKLIIYTATLGALISCEKKTEAKIKDVKKDTLEVNKSNFDVEAIPENCYLEASGKDTLFLKISDNLGTVTGKMHYKNFQKDSFKGDVVGYVDGDTIKLDYSFMEEGKTATREIWFLIKDSELVEGVADYDETGTKYKNPIDIQYEGGHILKPSECKDFDKKLK